MRGRTLGTVLATEVTGVLSVTWWGWPSAFFVFGACGIIWSICMAIWGYSSPMEHTGISSEELEFIAFGRSVELKQTIPWRGILTTPAVWAAWLSDAGVNWNLRLITTEFPTFVTKCLKFDVVTESTLLSIVYFATWLATYPVGFTMQYLINTGIISMTNSRKICNTMASWLPALFFIFLTFDLNRYMALFCIAMLIGSMSACYSGYILNYNDLSPNYSGVLCGVGGLGSTVICLSPTLLVQVIVRDHSNTREWGEVFWTTAIFTSFVNLFYIFKGSAEVQYWNSVSEKPVEDEKTHLITCKRSL